MKTKWGYRANDDGGEEEQKESLPFSPLSDLVTNTGITRCVENTIYFYADVTSGSCCELNRLLRDVDSKLNQAKIVMNNPEFNPIIHLRINSFGGDVFAAMSTVDTIRSLRSSVYSYIEGSAASAATLISVVAKKRFIGKNSLMLIHQLRTICSGTFEQLQDEHENNKRVMDIIKNLYKQYTKISMKELDNILKRDIWFDGPTSLKYGLVDEIY
jgi:ATP-dependent protease ClpP protease subunit